jgi:SnoaL-like domain
LTANPAPGNRTDDIVEITQTLARYSVIMTQGDMSDLLSVFTPDGTYSAFGDTVPLSEFPDLVAAAPKGLYLTGTPVVTFTGEDTATGVTTLCFIDHATHDMRIGYYNDTYQRAGAGWRLKTRTMTFIRRDGEHNSGKPHAYKRAEA